ncbi:MAG TPA: hypothetical protein VJY15_09910 [Candidatus Acidoferrum sp.]|nr:hypothetical protein [Candidatus Acidoferrum sp.]
MGRPRGHPLDDDSRLLLKKRLESLSLHANGSGAGLSQREVGRAISGDPISEQTRIRLEQHLLIPLHFKS